MKLVSILDDILVSRFKHVSQLSRGIIIDVHRSLDNLSSLKVDLYDR